MKSKILYILAVGILSSCSDDFLELYPETSTNEANFYQSDSEFVLLVNGSYIPMRNLGKTVYWDVSEIKSDNMTTQPGNTYIEHGWNNNFRLNSSSTTHESLWNNTYSGIYNTNKAIEAIEEQDFQWENPELKARSLGEVYFLRAMYYFDLVRQFGGVPLVTEGITGSDAVGIKRSSQEQTYQLIESDLKISIQHFSKSGTTNEYGRANLGAAQALLGKVYLTQKKYSQAEKPLAQVIESGQFGLLENYADVFDPSRKDYYETIFSIQYSESAAGLSNAFIFWNAPATSKGEVTNRPNVNLATSRAVRPTPELIEAFEDGDARFAVSIGEWTGPDRVGEIKDFFYCAKYKGPQSANLGWSGDNFPVLRYSDVLLMYAEVLNELGRTSDAVPYVEAVRHRANLMNDISGLTQEEMKLLIEKERQVEFCFENQRWYDLIRTDRAIDVLRAKGKDIQEHHLLAPIPGEQIAINQLTQNPGY